MLKVIRNRLGLFLAGLVAALTPMLMAPTGGYPSFPSFQSVTATSSGGGGTGAHPAFQAISSVPAYVWNSAGGGADQHNVQCYYNAAGLQFNCSFLSDTGGSESVFLQANRGTGTSISSVVIAGKPITSGTFTLTVSTGCTTTPNVTVVYAQSVNIVTLKIPSILCTISGTPAQITYSGLPASLQPTNGAVIAAGIENGGVASIGAVNISSTGTVAMNLPTGGTLSGTAGIATGFGANAVTVTYSLN